MSKLAFRFIAGCALLASAELARAQTTTLVSANGGVQGSDAAATPSISDDGNVVAFWSSAFDLVPGDTNFAADVFVQHRLNGVLTRVSLSTGGAQGNLDSYAPCVSGSGAVVAFVSQASTLVAGDVNNARDVFVHVLSTGATTRVSVDTAGVAGNRNSDDPCLTVDGNGVAFWSSASNLVSGDTNGKADVFFHDRASGVTSLVSAPDASLHATVANDHSSCSQLRRYLSGDGRFVAFESLATNLVADTDVNQGLDVFVRDRQTGTTRLASRASAGGSGNARSGQPSLSRAGDLVVFASAASNLVAGDTNASVDVFAADTATGVVQRVSLTDADLQANDDSDVGVLEPDGRWVAFTSRATNLVAGDVGGREDVFLRDLVLASTVRVSQTAGGTGGDGDSYEPDIAQSGDQLVFTTSAENLVPGDANQTFDVLLDDRSVDCDLQSYCTAKVNSLGCTPHMGVAGIPSVGGPTDDFHLSAGALRNKSTGFLMWSLAPDATPFAHGTLCVAAPITQSQFLNTGGNQFSVDCSGHFSFHFSKAYAAQHALGAGLTVYSQFRARDNGYAPPNDVSLTNGLSFTLAP